MSTKNVTIVGGGLGGLITSILLAREGIGVHLIEKNTYPFHRVCGEYISNEVAAFLNSCGLYPHELLPASINQLQLTSVNGKSVSLPLDLGGFGVSRYAFDHWLSLKAKEAGATLTENKVVESIYFQHGHFEIGMSDKTLVSDVVIGAHGKRSKIDVQQGRSFIRKRSPYVGVKYHIKTDHPASLIALHNFKNGYCGVSHIEGGKSNLCYLTHRKNLKDFKNIRRMEEAVLFKNPFIMRLFEQSEFIFEQPETINEISFVTKHPVENHIFMVGDAAGMIAPLAGNGMAMAIHASKLLVSILIPFCNGQITRAEAESQYQRIWNHQFKQRLRTGRLIQHMFGSEWSSNLLVQLALYATPLANQLIRQTHGRPF